MNKLCNGCGKVKPVIKCTVTKKAKYQRFNKSKGLRDAEERRKKNEAERIAAEKRVELERVAERRADKLAAAERMASGEKPPQKGRHLTIAEFNDLIGFDALSEKVKAGTPDKRGREMGRGDFLEPYRINYRMLFSRLKF